MPIDSRMQDNWYGNLTIRVERSTEPTIAVALPAGWIKTDRLGVINVEMPTPATIVSNARRHADPRALLVWARSGQYGLRIVKGVDPYPAGQTDLEVLTQRSLLATEA